MFAVIAISFGLFLGIAGYKSHNRLEVLFPENYDLWGDVMETFFFSYIFLAWAAMMAAICFLP